MAGNATLAPQNDVSMSHGISFTSGTLTVNTGSFNVTMAGPIIGSGGLNKTGTGNLIISGNNTAWTSGNVTIQGTGTVEVINQTAVNPTATGVIVQANSTFQVDSDLSMNLIRGTSLLDKTGPGTLTLSRGGSTFNAGATLSIDQGKVVMMDRDSLGAQNDTANSASAAVGHAQMNVIINPGTELDLNWATSNNGTNGDDRFGGSISMSAGTLMRVNVANPVSIPNVFSSYNFGSNTSTNYNSSLNIMPNATPSVIENAQNNPSNVSSQEIVFTEPVNINSGATLQLKSDNTAGNDGQTFIGFRSNSNNPGDAINISAGGTLQMMGPGQIRFGQAGSPNAKPIVGRGDNTGEALVQFATGSDVYMRDKAGSANQFMRLVVQGSGNAGLRIEAPMNAQYIDSNENTSNQEGQAGFFGVNPNTSGSLSASSVANLFTILSTNRLNGLSNQFGSSGTLPSGQLTIAATDAAGATGKIDNGMVSTAWELAGSMATTTTMV